MNTTTETATPTDAVAAFARLSNDERKDALKQMFSMFVNGANRDTVVELATDMTHDHRTLVQAKFGFFLQFCKVLSNNHKDGNFDLRNQFACETAAKIMDLVGGAGVPLI